MTTTRIALLRGVNVGGRKVVMSELKVAVEAMGFSDVRTLQAAGSLVFGADGRPDEALETALEAGSLERLGLKTDYHVRSAAEWGRLIAANPFPDQARDEPSRMVMMLFKTDPPAQAWKTLAQINPGRELIRAGERCAYLFYPDGIGASVLFEKNLIDRTLRILGTARNWNTVLKLAALAGG
ncbi:MAG: uncharacterized protein JWP35_968 [Caulobacter sp.]|nr:uncharacterized protein [Caulobacter sp.]